MTVSSNILARPSNEKLSLGIASGSVVLAAAGQLIYALPFGDTLLFLLAIFLLYWIPGVVLSRWLFGKGRDITAPWWLSFVLGLAVVPMIYAAGRRAGLPVESYWLLVAGFFGTWCWQLKRSNADSRQSPDVSGVAVMFFLLLLSLVLNHFASFTDVHFGESFYDMRMNYMTESIFHLGIVNAVNYTIPPTGLYMAGSAQLADYHIGMHLQIQMIAGLFELKELNLVYFYMPAIYGFFILLLPFQVLRMLGANSVASLAASLLVFGSDLSWLAAMAGLTDGLRPWTEHFLAPAWGLFTLNGHLPAQIIFFGFIAAILKLPTQPHTNYTGLLLLLLVATFNYKVTLGLHTAGAGIALGIWLSRESATKSQGKSVFLSSAIALMVMFVLTIYYAEPQSLQTFNVQPFSMAGTRAYQLGLDTSSLPMLLFSMLLVLLVIAGLQLPGLLVLRNSKRLTQQSRRLVAFLVIFMISGLLFSELVFIGYRGGLDNSHWFAINAVMAGWLLLAIWLNSLKDRSNRLQVLVSAIVVLLAWPATFNMLNWRGNGPWYRVNENSQEVAAQLRTAKSGTVVLHPFNYKAPSLAANLAGKPSWLAVHMTFLDEFPQLQPRGQAVLKFFNAETDDQWRSNFLSSQGISHVYLPASDADLLNETPKLERVLENQDWILFKAFENP